MTEFAIQHNPEQRRFEVRLGDELGVLQYRIHGDQMVITHTLVPPAYEGRGIGSALARAGLEYARQHRLEVVPLCSFVAVYMERHPEFQ